MCVLERGVCIREVCVYYKGVCVCIREVCVY